MEEGNQYFARCEQLLENIPKEDIIEERMQNKDTKEGVMLKGFPKPYNMFGYFFVGTKKIDLERDGESLKTVINKVFEKLVDEYEWCTLHFQCNKVCYASEGHS
jgi:hypothetical protein